MNITEAILNLYAGPGGNSYNWENVTAIEHDPKIAKLYQKLHPGHKVIVGDAIDYLEKYYHKYDIIWMSPPCPTHSKLRNSQRKRNGPGKQKPKVVNQELWQCVLFGKSYLDDVNIKWVVENVKPWYQRFICIPWTVAIDRHYFWSSNIINPLEHSASDQIGKNIAYSYFDDLLEYYNIPEITIEDCKKINPKHPERVLRDMVHPIIADHVIRELSSNRVQIGLEITYSGGYEKNE